MFCFRMVPWKKCSDRTLSVPEPVIPCAKETGRSKTSNRRVLPQWSSNSQAKLFISKPYLGCNKNKINALSVFMWFSLLHFRSFYRPLLCLFFLHSFFLFFLDITVSLFPSLLPAFLSSFIRPPFSSFSLHPSLYLSICLPLFPTPFHSASPS